LDCGKGGKPQPSLGCKSDAPVPAFKRLFMRRDRSWRAAEPDTLSRRITLEFHHAMKYTFLTLLMAASAAAVFAQTPTNQAPAAAPATTPSATPAPAAPAATAATTAKPATAEVTPPKPVPAADVPAQLANIHCSNYNSCVFVPPPGIPPAAGTVKTAFTLRYQDIKIGAGDVAEPNKEYIFHYTGWLASDGRQFDTSYQHRGVIMDKNQKPVKDANGKDELGPPQPLTFTQGTQGRGRILNGLDQGFEGMRVGGIRRIIIPYQLAYGARERPSPGPDYPVGIPAKSDLIIDVELLAVNDPPTPAKRGMGGSMPPPSPRAPAPRAQPGASVTPAQPASAAAPKAAAPAATPTPAAPANAAQPK